MKRVARTATLGLTLATLLLLQSRLFSHADDAPKDIATKKNPVESSDTVLAKAKSTYEENCLMCHGETGKGDGPMAAMLKEKPADLSDSKIAGELSDGEIFWMITKGEKTAGMPPFETKLSEDERWGMVHLMRNMSKTKPNNSPRKH
jgi:mono/diheme cytochrome c family protein